MPIEAIEKLLAEHPPLKGLVLPGMPPGSPGMAGDKAEPFKVMAIDHVGRASLYMTI